MAILSANSRRNSASPTVVNSPRPSIGNGNVATESPKPSMQPLNEEEVVAEPIPLPPPTNIESTQSDQTDNLDRSHSMLQHLEVKSNGSKEKHERLSKEKTCTERSDSGFSDCSNSSNGINANNVTSSHPLFDKVNSISEEKLNNEHSRADNFKDFAGKLSVNMLKMKLEKIAEAQQQDNKSFGSSKKVVKKLSAPYVVESVTDVIEQIQIEQKSDMQQMRMSYSFDFEDADMADEYDSQPKSLPIKPTQRSLMRSASLHQKRIVVEKEPIMKSDFTNTVKMRKKSLENNALREKQLHSPRILLEPSGKVSKLLRRFDSQNSTINGAQGENEPIVQTPSADDESKEITNEHVSNVETSKCDDEVVEILSTPMAAAQKSPTSRRKSPAKIAKTIVSSGSMKRTIASRHEYTNTKTTVTKVTMQRQSPTKFANASNVPINRAQPKAISNQSKNSNVIKKSQKSSATAAAAAADASAVTTVQRASRNPTTNKTSAYSSFNRTSPVRLSGRVKEVTDRLSSPKAIIKTQSPAIMRDRSDAKSSAKNTMAQAVAEHHHQMAMKSMSGAYKQQIVTVAEAIIETEHLVEHTINGKIDGTFTLKSKMNENFRKASAFWKAT